MAFQGPTLVWYPSKRERRENAWQPEGSSNMVAYRYSEWDGTQEIPPLDPDDLLEALTDDLMNFGDLQHALRNLLQRGMRNPLGQRMQGMRDLLQQLRQQRRQTLDRFNLGSAFEDIEKRLEEVLDMEHNTLDRRLQEALEQQGATGEQPSEDGERGEQPGEQPAASQEGEPREGEPSGRQGQRQGGQQGASQQPGQSGAQGQQGGGEQAEFARMLSNIAERKRQFLEGLPEDVPGKIKELQNY